MKTYCSFQLIRAFHLSFAKLPKIIAPPPGRRKE